MIVSNIAIFCCLVPFLMLFSKKIRQVTAYRVLGIYYLLNALTHVSDIYFLTAFKSERLDAVLNYYNLMDTPLALLIFACAVSGRHRRTLLLAIFLFIALEVTLVNWKGYEFVSGHLFTIFGVLVVIAFSIIGLIQYMRKEEYTSFDNTMVFIYGSLLFAYGSFLIISVFVHARGNNSTDSLLLYYIGLLIASIITSLGLWNYGLRRHPKMAA